MKTNVELQLKNTQDKIRNNFVYKLYYYSVTNNDLVIEKTSHSYTTKRIALLSGHADRIENGLHYFVRIHDYNDAPIKIDSNDISWLNMKIEELYSITNYIIPLYDKPTNNHCAGSIYAHGKLSNLLSVHFVFYPYKEWNKKVNNIIMGFNEGIHDCILFINGIAYDVTMFYWLTNDAPFIHKGLVVLNNDFKGLKYAFNCFKNKDEFI